MFQRLIYILSFILLQTVIYTHSINTLCAQENLKLDNDSLTKNPSFLINKGYITLYNNGIDDSSSINLGPQFHFFIPKNIDSPLHKNPPIIPSEKWEDYKHKTLSTFLNNGYPFASLKMEAVKPQNDTLSIIYSIENGNLEKIDTLIINGTLEIEPYFLYKYLEFKPGELFNFSKLQKAYKRINHLPFAEWHDTPEVNFTIAKNEWKLPINKRRANTIDGILGLQSSEETQTGIKITADIQLHLWNVLGMAEEFSLNYKNLEAQSPQLNIAANLPYFAGLDFGPEISFDLNIKDSSYQKNDLMVGIRYYLSYLNYIRMGYVLEQSNIITPSLLGFASLTSLPEINTYKNNGIVIGSKIQLTNDYWIPSSGWDIEGNIYFLKKNLTPHQSYLEEADRLGIPLREWYKEEEKEKYFWTGQLNLKKYTPLFKSFYLFKNITAAHKQINRPSLNELYRIGGQQGLRGFDELRFYTKSYSVFTLEPRMLINQRSYFFLFSDIAWLKEKRNLYYKNTYAWGLGAGISLFTETGLFNVAFGIGKEFPHSFDFKRTQVHIGYKAMF